jgi:DNA topoisomerase-3
LDDQGRVRFDFGAAPAADLGSAAGRARSANGIQVDGTGIGPVGLTCPKCGRGRIVQGSRGFGCDRYRDGCDFVVWCEIDGKRLTERQIADLVRRRHTGLIRGFRDESGRVFDARLELDPQSRVVLREPIQRTSRG